MPQAGAGPAPVPYTGPDMSPEPPAYMAAAVTWNMPGLEVMNGIPATGGVQESAYAHDVNAGLVTQFYPGAISPIGVHGDADPGGRDDVAGTVAGAVANSTGRYLEHEGDTHGTGKIGDLMTFPPSGEDPGAGVGNTMPTGGFYDPGRDYGGEQGAPGYQGDAQ
jgi:hypothetical protein